MSTIMLIRHGNTDWNLEEIFRGRVDVKLNKAGIKQAQLLAKYIGSFRLEAIYSSPLKRALKTAEIIAAPHHMNAIPTQELIDLDFGEWQGLSHDIVKERYGTLYAEWLNIPHSVKIPNGENLNDASRRACNLINSIIIKHHGTVALVSHRVIHKVIICALLGMNNSYFWNIRLDTCGITTFKYEKDRFILIRHNDTSFLKPLENIELSDF